MDDTFMMANIAHGLPAYVATWRSIGIVKFADAAARAATGFDVTLWSHAVVTATMVGMHFAMNDRSPLTADEIAAINLYSQEDCGLYAVLNSCLRDDKRSAEVAKFLPLLRLMVNAHRKLPRVVTTVYRYISMDLVRQLRVGQRFVLWHVISCSPDRTAFQGTLVPHRTVVEIAAATPVDISRYSCFPDEREMILLPGTEFAVDGIDSVGGMTRVRLHEVGTHLP